MLMDAEGPLKMKIRADPDGSTERLRESIRPYVLYRAAFALFIFETLPVASKMQGK
jgi:hypothetical protein